MLEILGVVQATSLIFMLILGIWLLIIAFQDSFLAFLLYLLIPFYSLYFVVTRWQRTKVPFLLSLVLFCIYSTCFILKTRYGTSFTATP